MDNYRKKYLSHAYYQIRLRFQKSSQIPIFNLRRFDFYKKLKNKKQKNKTKQLKKTKQNKTKQKQNRAFLSIKFRWM